MFKNKFLKILFVLLLILFFIIIIFIFKNNSKNVSNPIGNNIFINKQIYVGIIKNIKSNKIFLEMLNDNPESDKNTKIVDFMLLDNSMIFEIKSELKNEELYNKEMEEYNNAIKNVTELKDVFDIEKPSRETLENKDKSFLKIGQKVSIKADDRNNVKKIIIKQKEIEEALKEVNRSVYYGKIKKIVYNENDFVLNLIIDSDVDSNLEKEFTASKNEDIYLKVLKSNEEFEKENNEFIERLKNGDNNSIKAPSRYIISDGTIDLLNIGENIYVYTVFTNDEYKIEKIEVVK